ncbi:GTP-binding protein [Pseudomonas avellanae]|uniref:GTP-binding protein n=1 Tax=Pseudomonas avellanae TaxID=46257 RepID=A0A3M5U107_9PSED|nr:GTP-binding protein [Pseudomonas avellanae]
MGADMRALQLPRPRRPQPLTRVMGIPHVEITHLRANRCGNAKHLPGLDLPGSPGTNRHFKLLDQRALLHIRTQALVKRRVHLQRCAFADLVGGWVVFVHSGLLVGRMGWFALQVAGRV